MTDSLFFFRLWHWWSCIDWWTDLKSVAFYFVKDSWRRKLFCIEVVDIAKIYSLNILTWDISAVELALIFELQLILL
jgi:hypothetical protein